jgi:para-nitrobenzyl esterase
MAESLSWPLEVETGAGTVRGADDLENTVAWRGIPFGASPVGDLRWRAARDPEPWTGVRQCTEFGPAPWMPGAPDSSEDSLYLNVWRPDDAEVGLPVYVWVAGGANQLQVPRLSDTPGRTVASRSKVVFVSVSYRVGEMGWFCHPALRDGDPLDGSGNYGTLDIIKGLEWVRDNIAAFGGDPGNVTLTGESAGAYNTLTLLISPAARGLFHRVMSQSGRTETVSVEEGDEAGEAILGRLLSEEHAGDAAGAAARAGMGTDEVAAYLRSRTAEQLAVAARGLFRAGFSDGAVIGANGFASLDDGTYPNKVPAIIGMNQEETKFFLARRNRELQGDRALWEEVTSVASAQKRATGCDLVLRRLASNADQPPVYGYLFRWGWGGEHASPLREPTSWMLGACHGMDIAFFLHGGEAPLFGRNTFNEENEPGRTSLSLAMMGYLANFAHTGDPGTAGAGLPAWEPWSNDAGAPKLIVFDADLSERLVRMDSEELTVGAVRVLFDALPEESQKLAASAERTFALAAPA